MKAGQLRELFERRRRRGIRDFREVAAEAHFAGQLGAVGLFGNGPYSTFSALR